MTKTLFFCLFPFVYLICVPDAVSAIHPDCPAYESEDDLAVHLPHDTDCSKFYYCEHGERTERDCPDGLHFNSDLEVCDYPYRAGCSLSGTSSSAAPSSTSRPIPTRPPTTTTKRPRPPTTTTARPTPAPTTTTRRPRPPITTPASTTSSDDVVTGPSGLCPYPDPEYAVHLPHPDSTKFYHCAHGVAYEKDCPSPLKFNAALEVCDW